jgi:flagellar hook-basal body complex protein FliE
VSNSIEAIGFLPPSVPTAPWDAPMAEPQTAQGAKGASEFGRWFTQQIGQVDSKLNVADRELQALATGQTQNLHQTMIALEEAKLSFQLLVQVRNRVLEAYQDVMRMQV